MIDLLIFNFILLAVISVILILIKKNVRSKRTEHIIFLISALFTIGLHYSTLIYLCFTNGDALKYLSENPNLILPIYPCNLVMWSCLIFGSLKNKHSHIGSFLADYIFWFGIFSTLVGMFANVDFIMNPTLANYDIVKSIAAHATLLLNVLLLPLFGHIKINFNRCMRSMVISVLMMYAVGLYCNLVFKVIASPEMAYDVNSMFIIHSPFEGVSFLTYPVIACVALVLYFILFTVCELFIYEKGERWFNKILKERDKK